MSKASAPADDLGPDPEADPDSERELMCALYICELKLKGHLHSAGEHRDELEDVVEAIHDLRKGTQPTHFFGDEFQ